MRAGVSKRSRMVILPRKQTWRRWQASTMFCSVTYSTTTTTIKRALSFSKEFRTKKGAPNERKHPAFTKTVSTNEQAPTKPGGTNERNQTDLVGGAIEARQAQQPLRLQRRLRVPQPCSVQQASTTRQRQPQLHQISGMRQTGPRANEPGAQPFRAKRANNQGIAATDADLAS